ncbi:SEC-C metal-binding domain-containing protein [Nocardioides sp.]|uniref:SEC-C metal-binding domain-containing protein n=1 Tax=Nocardioides sp. TaxID=35761 RepID=UPI003425377D
MTVSTTCLRCGLSYGMPGFTFTNMTLQNNAAGNFVMRCPRCGHEQDVTGGVDGTYSSDARGNLRLVARLAHASRDELEVVRGQLAEAIATRDSALAQAALAQAGLSDDRVPDGSMSLREQRLWQFVQVLLGVIAVVVAMKALGTTPVTPERVQQVCAQVERDQRAQGAGRAGRNDPCPCGSGRKTKKCHGAPESVRQRLARPQGDGPR